MTGICCPSSWDLSIKKLFLWTGEKRGKIWVIKCQCYRYCIGMESWNLNFLLMQIFKKPKLDFMPMHVWGSTCNSINLYTTSRRVRTGEEDNFKGMESHVTRGLGGAFRDGLGQLWCCIWTLHITGSGAQTCEFEICLWLWTGCVIWGKLLGPLRPLVSASLFIHILISGTRLRVILSIRGMNAHLGILHTAKRQNKTRCIYLKIL